ncbi:putative reverse transcriptase domain-containing protein [Tanacetum coccineum]
MYMTIELSVKDKILATSSKTSKVENVPAEMLCDLDQQMEKRADDGCTLWIKLYSKYEYEIRYHLGKANVVIDVLRRKERVKPRCVRAMAMTIQYRVRGMILASQSEAFKKEMYCRKAYGLDELEKEGGREFVLYLVTPFESRISTEKLARLYTDEIVTRHGVPVSIISDRDARFTSRLWQTFQKALGTRLDMSITYHPQTDGQSESTIQTLEDMLRACVIDFGGSWDVHLPLAEFSYNNSYHTSIQCAPFEALYGRKCRSPVLWAEIGEGSLIRPELVQETTDKVVAIKERLKVARDRQKSYADNRRKPLEFEVGDRVMLKVSPWKGVVHFGKKGKLAPRYVGPFKILERIGPVAYRLRLPKELSGVHNTFHVSTLKKCLADASLHVPLNEIKVDKTLRFIEEPVEVLDREIKSLKRSKISLVKVCWDSKRGPEFPKGGDTMTTEIEQGENDDMSLNVLVAVIMCLYVMWYAPWLCVQLESFMWYAPWLCVQLEAFMCLWLDIRLISYWIVRNPWSSLIPLSHGSFDLTVGINWLSKRKFVIVWYEKVVRIPLEATPAAKSPYRLAPSEMQELSEQLRELEDNANVMGDALSRKERVKSRRVRGMILEAQSEAFKQENVLAERLHGLEQQMERKGDENLYFMDRIWVLLVRSIMDEAHASRSLVLWAVIRESSLTGLELVQETIDKVVLVKEKPKMERYRQKSYVDYRRNPLEFEVGDHVLLKVMPWKGVVHFGKKGKLALRYVGPFEILERIGLVAYRLRLPEELNSIHDTFCDNHDLSRLI